MTSRWKLRWVAAGSLFCAAAACVSEPPAVETASARWRFSDGAWLESVRVEPSRPRAGESVVLRWAGSPRLGEGLVWGIAPSQAAGWQHYPRIEASHWLSPRARTWALEDAQQLQTRIEIPASWQDRSFTLFAYRKQGESLVSVLSGARMPSSDPPNAQTAKIAIAGVVGLAPTRPTIFVPRAHTPIIVDGNDSDWPVDPKRHPLVHSLTGSAISKDSTAVRFAWDATHLFIFASMRDPDLWAPHQTRDDPLYRKEALEIFVGADGSGFDYLELQISAANVVYDARLPRHRQADRSYDGRWEHAVERRGTLNRRKDRDEGWSAELALPWEELCSQARVYCPVMAGTRIRVNVFRLESPGRRRQVGTALSATYRPDFHAMDRAATLVLSP